MSILEFFDNNYNLFNKFDGKLGSFKFPSDINEIFSILMEKVNDFYISGCKKLNVKSNDIFDYRLKRDTLGNTYLEVVGADNKTKIIIVKDNLKDYEFYKSVVGRKILESSFKDILNLYQTEKLKRTHISKRFLKDVPLPIDLKEEFDAENLKLYFEYLYDNLYKTKNISINFESPLNIRGPKGQIENSARERVNRVIDYDIRKQSLMSYNPLYSLNFKSSNKDNSIDVYIYEKNGYTMAICEPISGTSYTMYMNLGPSEYTNLDKIINNIKIVLESKENIVLSDDAVIRKSHTTLDSYKQNLETFLGENKLSKRFSEEISVSNEVYGRK